MGTLVQIEQLLLSLSILIILHEGGHFVAARLFKIRVEKFYLFFDPWFSLLKFKKGDTEYGIGWLPLGGYVKISGMIDESMDKEQMKQPPQPWEFRSKPSWQRLIVMVGGVTVNLILGILIYTLVIFAYGTETLHNKDVKYGIACDSVAYKMGLRNGDKIVSVDGKVIDNFDKIPLTIILGKAHSIELDRNGSQVKIPITDENISAMLADLKGGFIQPAVPALIDTVLPNSGAEKAGIKVKDTIVKIDSIPVKFFQEISPVILKLNKKDITVALISGGQTKVVTVHLDSNKMMGVGPVRQLSEFFTIDKRSYSIFASVPVGISKGIETIKDYALQLKVIFTVKGASKQVGGFDTIRKAYGTVWDWQHFWSFTGFLSIMLAFLNILPIPALDGGHVLFLLYEMITGRKPSEKFLEYAQYAGMAILLTILVYANGNDILRHFQK